VAIEIITPPAELPVTLEEIKAHCYVEFDADNAYLSGLLAKATEWVQWRVDRQLVTATLRQTWDNYPDHDHLHSHRAHGGLRGELRLQRGPVQSIESVKHYDTTDTLQTIDSATYWTALANTPARIVPKNYWPAIYRGRPEAIQVNYVAGYGAAADVPMTLKQMILLLAAGWYMVREPLTINMYAKEVPFGIESLALQFESAFA